jgi:hypothetical protein
MTTPHTSVKNTAARGVLVVGVSWLDSNMLFAPAFTGC